MIESDQRFTPQYILDVVRDFGRIVLDPCTVESNPVGAISWETEDGLTKPWWTAHVVFDGVTFWNPPYSRGQLLLWANKAEHEWRLHHAQNIGLIPADTSTRAMQLVLRTANAVAFWKRRIRFAGDNGAKFANASPYYGERQGRFKRIFEPHATVIVLR